MTDVQEVWYPGPEDLGISESMRSEIAQIILDQTIELPASGRGNRENYAQWDKESLVAYGGWLAAVLELDPANDSPITAKMIDRASRLGLGPSQSIIYAEPELGSLTEFQREIGFKPTTPFNDLTKAEIIRDARKIANRRIIGRLSRDDLNDLSRQGVLPGDVAIRTRFGTLRHFHELIGHPSFRGAEPDDLIEWGVAFLDQNPGALLGVEATKELAARKVGPSDITIRKHFGTIPEFRETVEQERESRLTDQEVRLSRRRAELKAALEDGSLPPDLMSGIPEDRHLQAFGIYQVARKLLPSSLLFATQDAAKYASPDAAAREIARRDVNVSVGLVEMMAEGMGIYDDIWPSQRFSNVNLKLAPPPEEPVLYIPKSRVLAAAVA